METATYEQLLCEARPEAIQSERRYDQVSGLLAQLVRKGRRRSANDTRLMRLLAVLVEDYDRRHALPPDHSSPAEILRHLLEVSGREPAALIPVFGQRSHVNEALRGKRSISAEQARKLGAIFAVKPGLFV